MSLSADIELNHKDLEAFYKKYFRYYNTLSEANQGLFTERALQFISEKVISGAEDFKPDNRVRALVAASAIQLTLGLETWKLNYFQEIELYPSDFDNTGRDLKFSGETNLQGYIKLSWKSFIHGYQVPDDNLNLGLHEFSHALRFNGIKGFEQDYFIDNYFNKWMACAWDAFKDVQNKKDTIFRKYGGANINEFLSVCIEHYFESPAEIKEKYPLLYFATGILLNQEISANTSKTGIRDKFLQEQNKFLTGFSKQTLQSNFLKHWTFKLWIFVFAVWIYTGSSSGFLNPIALAFLALFLSVFFWYHYNAIKIEFEGKEILFEKGSSVFKRRKTWRLLSAQLISIKTEEEEWTFSYYDKSDSFFYEEKIYPPEGVSEPFLKECRQNKIAVLK